MNPLKQIKECITFIFIKNDKGEIIPNGTGFFVGVKNEEKPENWNVYLVTAKHVLQDKENKYFPSIFIRLNKKEGGSEVFEIPLEKVYSHVEADVDIALFPCLPNQEKFEFKFLPDEMVGSNELIAKHQVTEGDEVFFTGLFTSHIGQVKNQPIIRFGKIALLSDEKVEWKIKGTDPKKLDLYLLECQSYGGNSGSPVFFQVNQMYRTPGQINLAGPVIILGGVMTGSFMSGTEVQQVDAQNKLYSLQNVGISAVTPAYKLHDILFYPALVTGRKATVDTTTTN